MNISQSNDQHMTADGSRYATIYKVDGKPAFIASRTIFNDGAGWSFNGCSRECVCAEAVTEIEIFEIIPALDGTLDGKEVIDLANAGRFFGKKVESIKTWEDAWDKVEARAADMKHEEGAKELADVLALAPPDIKVVEAIKLVQTRLH